MLQYVQKHIRQPVRVAGVAVGTRPNTARKTKRLCASPRNPTDQLAAIASLDTTRADNDRMFLAHITPSTAIDLV